MATHFPIVVEREDSGVFSAYVAGLPVYAQGATAMRAERAIQRTLTAYLEAHPGTASSAKVKVAVNCWGPVTRVATVAATTSCVSA